MKNNLEDYTTIIEKWVRLSREEAKVTYEMAEMEINTQISVVPGVSIIFDGHGPDEVTSTRHGNKNIENYAIFIHRDSLTGKFPEHEISDFGLVHRISEEVSIWAWYNVLDDSWNVIPRKNFESIALNEEWLISTVNSIDTQLTTE